jgi:uncharacterized protein (DUF488 family)
VDVRTAPGSRLHPQFNRDALAGTLAAAGISYEWRKDLGGFRRPRPESPHTAIRNDSFRGYADHMDTKEFADALSWLVETLGTEPSAIMCSETLWWRCHRRMIADALTARGVEVVHLLRGQREPHRLHPNARVVGGGLVYDVPDRQEPLPL